MGACLKFFVAFLFSEKSRFHGRGWVLIVGSHTWRAAPGPGIRFPKVLLLCVFNYATLYFISIDFSNLSSQKALIPETWELPLRKQGWMNSQGGVLGNILPGGSISTL